MKIRLGRLILWSAATLIVVLIALSFRPQPIAVDMADVQTGPLRVTIDEEGMTRVRDRYVVSAPVAGRLQRVELRPGDPVVAGATVLAAFMPATPPLLDTRTRAEAAARTKAAQAAREQARVGLQRARDDAVFSRNELERQKQISEFGGITEERLAGVELDARTKLAQVRANELALQRSEYELEAARAILRQIAAPSSPDSGAMLLRPAIDGTVLRVHQESEAPVAAGTPLIEVGNPNQLEIVSDFLSTDAVNVKPGFPVLISGWGGVPALRGRVRLVEPAGFTKVSALGVEEQRVNVVVDFEDAPNDASKLGDGFRVEVSIIVWEKNAVLKIPTSALFRAGDAWAVFAVRDGRAVRTAVRIGQRSALDAEVLSGLEKGAQVIVHPGDTVEDGVAVIRRE
jgi:HlyD family secretion protein